MKTTNGLSKVEGLFAQFIREKRYVSNLSEATLKSYEKDVFGRWKKFVGLELPTRENLNDFVIAMREAGLSITTCNITIRSFNSFLSWIHEHGDIPALRLKALRQEHKVMRTFNDEQLRTLLAWKPNIANRNEVRIFVITRFLLDTGCRINEALTLKTQHVDLDNLLVKVEGKGRKQRVLPISIEMRKSLYLYMSKWRQTTFPSEYVFCTSSGKVWSYQNARRELMLVCERMDISLEEIDGMFHAFRRKFARNYVRHGGNLLYLQQVMGHSSLQMTKDYVQAEDEDLQEVQVKTSILERIGGKR